MITYTPVRADMLGFAKTKGALLLSVMGAVRYLYINFSSLEFV